MKVVGLTGGIATGKSTVGHMLRERGVPVIDADAIAREVVVPGSPALDAIVAAFGPQVLGPDGGLDRAAMRHRISYDPAARSTLEGITHPAILQSIATSLQDLAADGEELAVVEAALMVETGSYRGYPAVVVVTCDSDRQLQRVVDRDGMSTEDARALISTQLPLADKEAVATHIVRNDAGLAELEARVDELLAKLRA